MKNQEKILREIREAEMRLEYASPKTAGKLTSKIVKLKATVFDKVR